MTLMSWYEYFRMKLDLFSQDIINKSKLHKKVDMDGNIFCEVKRGVYGPSQAGIIAQALLLQDYKCDTDWDNMHYFGPTLDHDNANSKVHLSMPG